MKAKRTLRQDLLRLVRQLQKREQEYAGATLKELNLLDRNRYEGIARGTQWAFEDLAKILAKHPAK